MVIVRFFQNLNQKKKKKKNASSQNHEIPNPCDPSNFYL